MFKDIKGQVINGYLLATISALIVLLFKFVLPLDFNEIYLAIGLISIVVCTVKGGMGPGLIATLLNAIAINFFLNEPFYKKELINFQTNSGFTFLLVEGLLVSWIVGSLRLSEHEAIQRSVLSFNKERYLKRIMDNLDMLVGVITTSGKIIETNQYFSDNIDLKNNNEIGKYVYNSHYWKHLKDSKITLIKALKTAKRGHAIKYDTLLRFKNNDLRVFEVSIAPLLNEESGVDYLLIIGRDVDFRVKTLKENLELYKTIKRQKGIINNIINNIPGIVWELKGRSLKINFMSDYVASMLGHNPGECIKNPNFFWSSIVHPEDKSKVLKQIKLVYKKNKEGKCKFRCITKTGKTIWVESRFVVKTNDLGRPIGMEGVITNIDDQVRLEEIKDEFIRIAGHEIKTPMTTIKAFSQILETRVKNFNDKKSNLYISKINDHINKLNQIINDFLDFSKIESGKLDYHKEKIEVLELLTEVINDMQSIYKTHKIILKGNQSGVIYGDKIRVSQVLINLITNAVKYSPKKNMVVVELKLNKDKIIIIVKDFGIGISKENQKKIFEKFYRVRQPKKMNIEGFGLGLYITKTIIKRHGGKIWVESKENEGSNFYISLPYYQDHD